jgi:type IV pilus assembly protein PilX
MKAGRMNGRRIIKPRSQRGVVLLIALIMLVAMTLAGIGMMRSVDTGSVIAGNLAFKQATLNASDAGTIAGFNALVAVANSNNLLDKVILNFNGDNTVSCATYAPGATAAPCTAGNINLPGYSATPFNTCEVTGQTNGFEPITTQGCSSTQNQWWTKASNWSTAPTFQVNDPTSPTPIATVSYLIHRMCRLTGDPNLPNQLCQTYTTPATGCSKTQLEPCTGSSVFYRVTSRSVGLRNTVTYTQTLVLIGT